MKIEIRHSRVAFWCVLLSRNGKVMLTSETYYSMSNARRAARRAAKAIGIPCQEAQ
jgi:uncharacterized protein YegP (UPF0339 family)